MMIATVAAQERVPGISAGDEFTFSQQSYWASNDPIVPIPAGLADINMTDYYRVTITGVSGSNVSTHTKWQFLNGSSIELDGSVSTKTTAYQGGYWAIIGSNLNQGDRIHPNFQQDMSIINETVTWSYQDYQRQTNHVTLNFLNEQSDIPNATYTETVDTYFDRQTGALVHLSDIHAYHNPDVVYMVTWQLVSQNAWTGADSTQSFVLPIIVATIIVLFILTLGVIIYRKKKAIKKLNFPKS